MQKFIINGKCSLHGTIQVHGAKNAALAILPAALLTSGESVLRNVPQLRDIKTMCKVLEVLGASVQITDTSISVNTENIKNIRTPYDLVKTMRASIYVLGPLIARFKQAEVSLPGGCAIGQRPIDLHLKGLEKMGVDISIERGFVVARTEKLRGAEIIFDKVSVGATVNLLMAATCAEGETILRNAAQEPEVTDIAQCLVHMGANINGIGTDVLHITGVSALSPYNYDTIPDRIVAGTYILAAAITRSKVSIKDLDIKHLGALITKLKEMGVRFTNINTRETLVDATHDLTASYIKTMPYPGFPTDIQPLMMALMTTVSGNNLIHETIFENRFTQIGELVRMGADIEVDGEYAVIQGVQRLSGAPLIASDLRCGAALILAGMAAEGKTEVDRIYHIDRGYYKIEEALRSIGADIVRA